MRRALALAAGASMAAWMWANGLPTPISSAAPKDRPAFGFDHLVHAGQVSVAGKRKLACTACHTIVSGQLRGRPDHGTCFGRCHGKAPKSARVRGAKKLSKRNQRICARCHSPSEITRYMAGNPQLLKVSYPPYVSERDFGIGFSHAKHDAASRSAGGKGCQSCHQSPGARTAKKRAPKPHSRCVGCHLKPSKRGVPTMGSCNSCHKTAYGPAADPHQTRGRYPVTTAFSHQLHASRLPAGADCRACHANVAKTNKLELATPPKSACQSCHDGTKAFSTEAPTCRQCHKDRGDKTLRSRPPRKRFSHSAHIGRGMRTACSTCHQLDSTGRPRTAARNHAPCSDAGCHRKEFGVFKPTICGACHVSVEPWRELHHDRPPPLGTEYGARFSHKSHLGGAKPPMKSDCGRCHKRKSGRRDLALPRDHSSCSGSGCHQPTTATAGAKPALSSCSGCHVRGLVTARDRQRRSARFSVRKRFRHKNHMSLKGAKVSCARCHVKVTRATTAANVPTPSKASCASCHDGKTAFKVTGHGCAKCHAR